MKYTSCDLTEHGLVFDDKSIKLCFGQTIENIQPKEFIPNYNGELLNLERFFALKRFYRKKMKAGSLDCCGCPHLEEKEYDEEDYIDTIIFNQGNICNSKCVYCPTAQDTNKPYRYSVYPVIRQLADGGYLRKGGSMTIAGGEPVIAKDFHDLLTLFLDLGFENIKILTNGILYSDLITRGVKQGSVNLLISLDSGTPEMYRWIKGSDSFNFVWDNIKTYAEHQCSPNLVKTKYVIIPTINDIKDEVTKFLDKVKENGVSAVVFDVENFWYIENKNTIPKSLNDFLKFTAEEAKKRNLAYEPIGRASKIFEKMDEKII